jgi:hypothetical protein
MGVAAPKMSHGGLLLTTGSKETHHTVLPHLLKIGHRNGSRDPTRFSHKNISTVESLPLNVLKCEFLNPFVCLLPPVLTTNIYSDSRSNSYQSNKATFKAAYPLYALGHTDLLCMINKARAAHK